MKIKIFSNTVQTNGNVSTSSRN